MKRVVRGTPIRAPGPIAITGDTHPAPSTTVDLTVDAGAAGWSNGMTIVGPGIPDGTTIAAINAGGRPSITISNPPTASQAGVTLEAIMPHQWVPVGPMVCARGQAKGLPRVSGRFRALAVSTDGQRIYAGSAMGGVWYSGDGGARWKGLDFYASTKDTAGTGFFSDALTVGAIGVKWGATANDDVVYVGAGEHPLTELKGTKNPEGTVQGVGTRVATGPAASIGGATGPWFDPWKLELTNLKGILVNRIFVRQSDGAVWAATSRGLYRRPAGAALGAAWQNLNTGFGDTDIADVAAVTEDGPPRVERVYAATPDGRIARSMDGGAWQAINLPPFAERRYDTPPVATGSINANRVVTRMRLAVGSEKGRVIYALAEGPRLWRIDGDTASRIIGLPDEIFDASKDADKREDARPPYGMCLAVHPQEDSVAVGGEAYTPPGGMKQAALFFAPLIAATAASGDWTFPAAVVAADLPRAEWSGAGIPIGVHALAWTSGVGAANPSLWVAGESGIFRSTNGAASGSFAQRNSGLTAIESIAFAQSSGSGSVMLLSTPSGALERISGETWKLSLPGRTGGVAIDPARAYRMYVQVERSVWKIRDLELDRYETSAALQGWQPLKFLPDPPLDVRGTAFRGALEDEAKNTAPVSRAALIATRANGTQIAIGTDRIWYSDDFMKSSTVDTRTGDTHQAPADPTVVDNLSVNVHTVGWRAGMPIDGPGIPADTSIVSIAGDGLSVVISNPAQAANNGVALRVNKRNTAWVTLPSGTNPYAPGALHRWQDVLHPDQGRDRGVLMARWGTPDRLYVLTTYGVFLLERQVNGSWTKQQLYDQIAVEKATKLKTPAGQIPYKLALTSLDVRDGNAGTLYLGASGHSGEEHVWYYDAAQWVPTGLRAQIEDTPVHTVVVDPIDKKTLYAGTDAGVWKGVGAFPPGAAPTWTWTHFSTALPEAPCVDLAITTPVDLTRRALRAAFAGRGVWEVALDDSILQRPEVYLRAHDLDARREAVPPGGPSNPVDPAGGQLRLDASPDIRVWRQPLASPAGHSVFRLPPGPLMPPPDYMIFADPFDRWLLQSALKVWQKLPTTVINPPMDDLDPDAPWSKDSTRLRDLLRDQLAGGPFLLGVLNPTPDELWSAILRFNQNALPFDREGSPDYADLILHLRDEPDRWPKGTPASCTGHNIARVFVGVHSQHWRPVPAAGATVSVALLRTAYSGRADIGGTWPLPNGWAASLMADAAAAGGPFGAWMVPAAPLAQRWFYADPAKPFRQVTADLDQNNSQMVVFDADLSGGSWERPGWLLLAVVWTDEDPVTNNATDVGEIVRNDHHVAARSLRNSAQVVVPTPLYAGMDAFAYPGPAIMSDAWSHSNMQIAGVYLAPTPQFVAGVEIAYTKPQNGRSNQSWMGAWNQLHEDWGIFPIYFGQQDPANAQGPVDLRATIANANAGDASNKAFAAGIPRGAVIYLDWETVPNPAPPFVNAGGLTYCGTFWRALAALGYRSGVYCYPPSSLELRAECPGLFVWNVNRKANKPGTPDLAPYTVIDGQLWQGTPTIQAAGRYNVDRSAIARQWSLVNAPAGNPIPGWPQIDTNSSVVADPAFPERGSRPRLIRTGPVSATSSALGGAFIYAIRNGRPNIVSWPPPPVGTVKPLVGQDHWWNPFSPIASVNVTRLAGTQNPEHLLLALVRNQRDGDGNWRLHALQRPVLIRDWTHLIIASAGVTIDPLPGVAATARGDLSIDGFVVDDVTGQIASCRWDPVTAAWSPLGRLLTAPPARADVTAPSVRRTNRLAAVGRGAGIVDVFWVGSDPAVNINTGDDGRLFWTLSGAATPNAWSIATQIGSATIRAHPLANLAAVSIDPNRIDVLFMGRDGAGPWQLYDFVWDGVNWVALPDLGNPAGAAAVNLDPMTPIGVCRVDANTIDAFAIGMDGELYQTEFTIAGNSWSAFTRIGLGRPPAPATPVRLASVDGASCAAPNDRQAVATGRDGNVYATGWDGAAFTPLEQITPLNV